MQVNEWAGVLLAYLFYPVGWENSWFGQYPSMSTFDASSTKLTQTVDNWTCLNE
jgi:hypothetical protein